MKTTSPAEIAGIEGEAAADQAAPALKRWVTPVVIVATARQTEGGVTRFTDGTSHGAPYGS